MHKLSGIIKYAPVRKFYRTLSNLALLGLMVGAYLSWTDISIRHFLMQFCASFMPLWGQNSFALSHFVLLILQGANKNSH